MTSNSDVLSQQSTSSEIPTYEPKTPLGKKLLELRLKVLAVQPPLTSWEDLEQEIAERKGVRE